LPGHGISRAQLAAEVLGDSHGLDNGRPVATIVLRARTAETSIDVIEAALVMYFNGPTLDEVQEYHDQMIMMKNEADKAANRN
jgi:uncharacterized protein DUF3323